MRLIYGISFLLLCSCAFLCGQKNKPPQDTPECEKIVQKTDSLVLIHSINLLTSVGQILLDCFLLNCHNKPKFKQNLALIFSNLSNLIYALTARTGINHDQTYEKCLRLSNNIYIAHLLHDLPLP